MLQSQLFIANEKLKLEKAIVEKTLKFLQELIVKESDANIMTAIAAITVLARIAFLAMRIILENNNTIGEVSLKVINIAFYIAGLTRKENVFILFHNFMPINLYRLCYK